MASHRVLAGNPNRGGTGADSRSECNPGNANRDPTAA
jgi:hypothetical protein